MITAAQLDEQVPILVIVIVLTCTLCTVLTGPAGGAVTLSRGRLTHTTVHTLTFLDNATQHNTTQHNTTHCHPILTTDMHAACVSQNCVLVSM